MIDDYDLLPAVRQDLDLLIGDLIAVSGQLEELATMWRRQCQAGNSWPDMPHAFPPGLRDAAGQLAVTLRALAGADPDQTPDLASSAAAQLSALDAGIAAAVTGCAGGEAQQGTAGIRATMSRAAARLDHPGKSGGSGTWKDAGPWRCRRNIPMSCANAR